MKRERIVITFDQGECVWGSVDWPDNPELHIKAEEAIDKATTPAEVIINLTHAGFRVIEV